jgi:hypothetical protein
MRRIRKFFLVPRSERGLLVRATVQLGAISLGLRLLPFQTVRRLIAPGARPSDAQQHADSFSPDQIGWAVSVAGRYVPGGGTCLPQALATHVLLEREGYAARLRIGLARDEDGRLQAHAWVESLGRVVIGGSDVGRYTPLMAVDSETP